jgi:endonuclease G
MDSKQLQQIEEYVRVKGQRFLQYPGVTSVGVGYRQKNGRLTDQIAVQFTVDNKLAPEALAKSGMRLLPPNVTIEGGKQIPTDVIEREYEVRYGTMDDGSVERIAGPESNVDRNNQRRRRLAKVQPGVSIANARGTAGTLGAIVFDKESGRPLVLSNWHVLHGPSGAIGDAVVQPGPYDNSDVKKNSVGRLLRSHLGAAGDCAIATLENRLFDERPLGLDSPPQRTQRPNLGDRVVKSGRTTGVTYGVVRRTQVYVKLNYGGNVGTRTIQGFEIGPDPARPADRGEISMGGDSGSLWVLAPPPSGGKAGDTAVGLHFAGETDPDPGAEHALACYIDAVLDKLNVSFDEPHAEDLDDEELMNELLGRIAFLERRITAVETAKAGCTCRGHVGDETSLARSPVVPAAGAAPPRAEPPANAVEGISIPVYGNWCGPGHGGGIAIDDVDAACMRHDQCYGAKGYFDVTCDAALIAEMAKLLASGRLSPQAALAATAISGTFVAMARISIPVTAVRSVATGATRLWRSIKRWF